MKTTEPIPLQPFGEGQSASERLPETVRSYYKHNYRLEKGGSETLDIYGRQLIAEDDLFVDEVELLTGERLAAVAEVGVPHLRDPHKPVDRFIVLDTTGSLRYEAPYILFREEDGRPVAKGIWPGKTTVVGRKLEHKNKFHHSEYVSGSHFSVKLNDSGLEVTDLHSTNGTSVTGFIVADGEAEVFRDPNNGIIANFTEEFGKRAAGRLIGFNEQQGARTPYGTLEGYAIIGRNSLTVRGGVYGTIRPDSEFVLIDHESPQVKELERELLLRTSGIKDGDFVKLLPHVRALTAERMKYDLAKVESICSPYYSVHGIIRLSELIDAGVGVCRQQALLAATLIESLIEKGKLHGSVHVERNHDTEAHGAHAWAVLSGASKEDIIIDPAQKFLGTRKTARESGKWRYYVDVS